MVDHGSSLVAVSRQHACDARTTIQDFEDLNTLVENQINQSIKNMRIDRTPGHTAHATRRWVDSKGIRLQYAPPDGHGEIGRAEACIGLLNRNARTLDHAPYRGAT